MTKYNAHFIFNLNVVFFFLVRWPFGVDFSDPESQGLTGARNLYLETDGEVKVGVW